MNPRDLTNDKITGKILENRGKKKLIKRLIKELQKELKDIEEETEELLVRYQEE